MDPVALSYGLAAWAVFYFAGAVACFEPRRQIDAVVCSGVLLLTWGVSNLLWMIWGREAVLLVNPPMDLACGVLVAAMYRREPAVWKAALALVFMTQALVHVWFWTFGMTAYSHHLILNLGFALALVCVTLPGGGYVAGRVGDWMRRRAVRRGVVVSRRQEEG